MLPGWSRVEVGGKSADAFDPPGGAPRFGLLYLHPVGLESLADNAVWTAELTRHRIACCVPFGMRSWWADRVCPEFDPTLTAERHLLDNVLPWMTERWAAGAPGEDAGGTPPLVEGRSVAQRPGGEIPKGTEDSPPGASGTDLPSTRGGEKNGVHRHDQAPLRPGSRPLPLALAGISMGGQGALRLGFKYPELFPVVAGVASAIEYERWHGQGTPLDEMYRSREACRQDTAGLHIRPNKTPPHIWFACDPADEEWHRGNDRLHEKLLALGVAHEADLETELGGHSWAYFDGMAPRLFAWLNAVMEKQSRRLM